MVYPNTSSFLGIPHRILHMNPKKEVLWSLWFNLYILIPLQGSFRVSDRAHLICIRGRATPPCELLRDRLS